MCEHKTCGHNEQNLTLSDKSSVVVRCSHAEQILASLKKDRRSAGKIFNSLCQEIINFSNGRISEVEATEAARNLIGLFEIALEIPEDKRSNKLDETQESS